MLVDALNIGLDATRVGVVAFSENPSLMFPLNRYSNALDIKQLIVSIPHINQATNIAPALTETRTECFSAANGARSESRKFAILTTSGVQSNPGTDPRTLDDQAKAEAEVLKSNGVTLIPVGVTSVVDLNLLEEMSSSPHREEKITS